MNCPGCSGTLKRTDVPDADACRACRGLAAVPILRHYGVQQSVIDRFVVEILYDPAWVPGRHVALVTGIDGWRGTCSCGWCTVPMLSAEAAQQVVAMHVGGGRE